MAAPPAFPWLRLWRPTAIAVVLYVVFRFLPTGTNLSHMDFRPDGSSVEMCDPSNPQFIPVVEVRSPVVLTVLSGPGRQGEEAALRLRMTSASGRPVGPEDLAVTHTQKLHLLVIDPSLEDYQHLHPVPAKEAGEWTVNWTPRLSGTYRIFADFTPLATGRGLYGFADVSVEAGERVVPLTSGFGRWQVTLQSETERWVAGQQAKLALTVTDPAGEPVPLEKVMDAYAHLVAFDSDRLGYAHLHPLEADPLWQPDPRAPRLTFAITIPRPGPYRVWAQLRLAGRESYVPFAIQVTEP